MEDVGINAEGTASGNETQRLIETVEKRRPFFQKIFDEKLAPFLANSPQTKGNLLQYAIAGSCVWSITGLAENTRVANSEAINQLGKENIINSQLRALLLVPSLIPDDIDTVVIHGNAEELKDDVFENRWRDERFVCSIINGNPIYTVHPADAWAHSLVFLADHGMRVDKREAKAKKLEWSLRALSNQFSYSELAELVDKRLKSFPEQNYARIQPIFLDKKKVDQCYTLSPSLTPAFNEFYPILRETIST